MDGGGGGPREGGRRSCFCLSAARPPSVGVGVGVGLPAHLQHLKLSQLQRLALDAGVDADRVEEAVDKPDPRAAIAELLAAAAPPEDPEARRDAEHPGAAAALRQELSGLKLKALKSRARDLGVSDEALDDADDADDIKAAVMGLCIEAATVIEEQTASSFPIPDDKVAKIASAGLILIAGVSVIIAVGTPDDGPVECLPCLAGRYAEEAATTCEMCAAGQFSEEEAGSCTPCPAGGVSHLSSQV